MNGYDDNGYCIIFTNIEGIETYEKNWKSEFNGTDPWRSNSTKNTNSGTQSKGTHVSINYSDELKENIKFENGYKEDFKTQDENQKFAKTLNKRSRRNNYVTDDCGFKKCSYSGNESKVVSWEELKDFLENRKIGSNMPKKIRRP